MSSLRPPNQYRTFMSSTQGVFPQSLSGSETDVSTSNENLSNEEKYVIRHTARQEPQGQENLNSSNRNSLQSNRSSLDVSSSSYNTLIIHSLGDESWTGRNSGPTTRDSDVNLPSYVSHQVGNFYNEKLMKQSPSPSPSMSSNGKDYSGYEASSSKHDSGVQEITEIPDDYLNQSSVLKHLAKEVKSPKKDNSHEAHIEEMKEMDDYMNRQPPEYNAFIKSRLPVIAIRNKNKNFCLSKSQPDLSKIGLEKEEAARFQRDTSVPRPRTKGREESNETRGEDIWPSIEMVEILIKENSALKLELEQYYHRIARTQKLEQEMLNVHHSHEELVQSSDRRERLERAARTRLQSDCRRLQELNRALREQVDLLSTQMLTRLPMPDQSAPENIRRELNKRDVLIAQLIHQNKELVAAKDRQEIELAAQRATLQEQRTHIDILEAALTNAQGNVVRLEEESRKKQVYVERVVQLQRALASLQLASDRREQTERKLRLQLEMELERTKSGSREEGKLGWDSPSSQNLEHASELKKRLRDREEKIMRLEGECSKWEQRYLEESALRQAAIDAASIPKDAKIAALEKTSQETEKIIAEARNEKIRHMDEAHAAQKKVADLESRLKDLESKLAERDAMIRVLQKHTYDKDVSNMLNRSPHHTPHQSLAGSELDHVLGASVSREELVSSVLTSSTSFGSGNSYTGSDSSYMPSYKYESKSFDSTKKTLDNQIKEIDNKLDSQLLSKRALCCFPGFTNPVTAQRKGKIPKPLLASVTNASNSLYDPNPFGLSQSRHESGEMLLLEKQGRSSQQQRMQETISNTPTTNNSNNHPENLPPSSLPRPPRSSHRATNVPRRLGEYNRLPDTEIPRKKSDGGESLSSNASSRRASPARSLIPPPRKLGEYGRLSESGGSSVSLRKPAARMRSGERDSASTFSDNSASSLPHPNKVRFFSGPTRRGSSLGRDSKSSTDSTSSKFRIQF